MTVLVTGAAGFVGGAVASALVEAGTSVRGMVRRPCTRTRGGAEALEYVFADLADVGALRSAAEGASAIVHAAARLGEFGSRKEFWDTNVTGTERLLAAARAAGVAAFVFIGSPSALMPHSGGDQVRIKESVPFPHRFLNLYSETKAAAEQRVLAASAAGFRTIVLRPRAVWGPGDRHGPIVQILAKLHAGKLPDLSPGRPVYASLCYIDHLVAAVQAALNAEQYGGRSYFIADAEPVDVWPMLAELARRFGLDPPARRIPAPVLNGGLAIIETLWRMPLLARRFPPPLSRYAVALLTRTATYDTSAAAADLGFAPQIDHETGLARFEEWVREYGGLTTLLEGARE